MTESLPATALVRVSRATFDPSRFAEVDAVNKKTSDYLIPATKRLPGLIHFMRASRRGARPSRSASWTPKSMRRSWTG
jgi:hypothetical protein